MKSSLKFGLEKKVIAAIRSVLEKYNSIEDIIVYGSRAKGNYRDGSDIDLALVAPKLNTDDLLKIEGELDDLMLPYKIDLCLQHHVDNQNLIAHIQRVGQEFK